jgi:predicted DNA-binding ribbon-helix-helix protein
MQSSIVKHSVVIAGHKTSISLEEPFWRLVSYAFAGGDPLNVRSGDTNVGQFTIG